MLLFHKVIIGIDEFDIPTSPRQFQEPSILEDQVPQLCHDVFTSIILNQIF